MLEQEKQALLTQVTTHIDATERKLRAIGLPFVKVGLFDERTRQPISQPQHLIDMAEGREPEALRDLPKPEPAKEAGNDGGE